MLSQKEKCALTQIIKVFEDPAKFGIYKTKNTTEQNQAVAHAFRTLFDCDEKGNVKNFNEQTLDEFLKTNEVYTPGVMQGG